MVDAAQRQCGPAMAGVRRSARRTPGSRAWLVGVACTALVAGCSAGGTHGDRSAPTTRRQGGALVTEPGPTTRADRGPELVTRTAGRFSVQVPSGFQIEERSGVYVLADGERSMSFSRTATDVSAEEFGDALLGQLGGEVASRTAEAGSFAAEVDRDGSRELVVVRRKGDAVVVATGHAPAGEDLSLATVQAAADSAEGAVTLTPPPATSAAIELEQYQAPDGGATGLVPAGSDWSINSRQGSIEGSSASGSFLFGFTIQPMLPENAPAGGGGLVAPYLSAPDSIGVILPALNPAMSDVQVTKTIAEDVIAGFSSSGMYAFEFTVGGQRWTSVVIVATDDPAKYSNFVWNFYYSGIAVPEASDGSVGAGLLQAWQSWNPSGAIAQRAERSRQLLDETNEIWRDTSEFRQKAADQQSRDVGCLLQGYYHVEDNARKYDLPPAPCGQEYVPN